MESSQPRPSQAYIQSHRPVLAPQPAQRIARRATRCRPKRAARKALQDVRPGSLGSYLRPVDNIRQSRMMPVRDRMYDRQPQLVATPEDEQDDEMVYHDEEFVLFLSSPPSLPPSLFPSLFDLFYFLSLFFHSFRLYSLECHCTCSHPVYTCLLPHCLT
ncbi:hypothetical protein BKA60DRAFT_285608 [Fusarium oxysporum]|nr:hypothetical protein BKA60DRAFT_285608 [Fusarium oxysporum]